MGYAYKWQPPAIPIRANLTVWKALFLDLDSQLLAAGLVHTSTAGQLNISSVSALPADGAFAGFIEYALTDALQATAPVIIKLEFGCGVENMDNNTSSPYRSSQNLRVRCTVTFKGGASTPFGCPQSYDNAHSSGNYLNTLPGKSYICNSPSRGFLGVVYGAGSRGTWESGAKQYTSATFCLFLQRTTDAAGNPTGDGLALYYPGFNAFAGTAIAAGTWTGATLPASFSEFLPAHSASVSRSYARRIGAPQSVKSANAELLFEPIYYSSPGLKMFPYIMSYNYENLADGSELQLDIGTGVSLTFVAVGRETSIVPDDYDKQTAGILMLLDGD